MDKLQKGRLEWFLNFINLDLNNIPFGEVVKLLAEINFIQQGIFPNDNPKLVQSECASTLFKMWADDKRGKAESVLNLYQSRLKHFMENMQDVIKKASRPIVGVDVKTKEESIFLENGFGGWQTLGDISSPVQIKAEFPAIGDTGHIGDRVIKTAITATKTEDTLLIYFIQSLSGITIGNLKPCPECGNWFLHTSKRIKLFCSNKCAARKVSRDRRQRLKDEESETYDKELKEGAKRARKSYEKKVKSKTPGAQIDRRPRKYKQ